MKLRLEIQTLALALMYLPLFAQQSPFLGTWKMDLDRVKIEPGPGPTSPTTTLIEAVPGGMRMTVTAINSSGKEESTVRPAFLDGKDYPITGANAAYYDSLAVTQIDSRTWKELYKKDGHVVRMGRRVVSSDGLTMTFTAVGISPGGKFESGVTVYDKK